ncbi:MAG: PAS domain S-box protein, partial [Caldilineaceae bacterium]|nr:PAS domain S-box protein [Caldilineaceae bacterium]
LIGLTGLIMLTSIWFPEADGVQGPLLVMDGLAALVLGMLYWLVTRGRLRATALVLAALIYGVTTFVLLTVFQSVFNPVFAAYFLLIPMAGLLLGKRWMEAFTLLVLATLVAVFALQATGVIIPVQATITVNTLMVLIIILVLSFLLHRGSLEMLERKTRQAERTAASLARSRDELEEAVARRTEDLHQANLALQASEARYRTLVEHAAEAIVLIDQRGWQLMDVNRKAEELFGYPREELIRKTIPDLSAPTQPSSTTVLLDENLGNQLDRGNEATFEWIHRDRSGREFLCEVRLIRMPGSNPHIVRGTIVDITNRRRQEEMIQQTQKLESLGILAGGIAHD